MDIITVISPMKKLYELIQKNSFFAPLSGLLPKNNMPTATTPPIITLSREKGSGGRPIAYLVAKKLGSPWKVFHKEIIDEMAKETRIEKEMIKEIDESNLPLMDELIADLFGKRYLNLPAYHRNLIKILSTLGQRGRVIIVGRGANFLFPDSLKTRVICEMPQRIRWLMEYEKMTKKQAIKIIADSDCRRNEFVRMLYNHDQRKAHHYDLIIRTGPHLSIEDAAELIVNETRKRFKF